MNRTYRLGSRLARSRPSRKMQRSQTGVLLLEALIAILIFSLGILGSIGLQAASIKQATAAEDRAKAAALANDLIGRMWSSDHDALATNFGTSGTGFTSWMSTVTASQLPGITSTANKPTISFSSGPSSIAGVKPGTRAEIVIKWQAHNESAPHQYTAIAVIK